MDKDKDGFVSLEEYIGMHVYVSSSWIIKLVVALICQLLGLCLTC